MDLLLTIPTVVWSLGLILLVTGFVTRVWVDTANRTTRIKNKEIEKLVNEQRANVIDQFLDDEVTPDKMIENFQNFLGSNAKHVNPEALSQISKWLAESQGFGKEL